MPQPADLTERVARIEETMATREELEALRATVEKQGATSRRIGGAVTTAAIALGFLALLWVFTG